MLIGYSMPAVSAIALSGGAGYAWLTSDNGSACYDGKPARRARLRWRNDAVPAIGHTLSITLDIASTPLRVVAALGLKNVPAGAKVEVYGKRAADAGTTYNFGGGNTGTVQLFADGTAGLWFVLPAAATAVTKIEFRLFNDNAGATWAIPATTLDIGELVAMPAVEIDHEPNWTDEPVDPSLSNLSLAAQPSTVRRQAYRRLECSMTPDGVAKARAGGLANGMDWSRLRVAMFADGRVVGIVRWLTSAGAIDTAELHQTAIYGTARMGGTSHLGGNYYGASVAFQEVPALA